MHPTLARFLSSHAAQEALLRENRGESLDDGQKAYGEAARAHPALRKTVLSAKATTRPGAALQQPLLVLASHAALVQLSTEPALAPLVQRVRTELAGAGVPSEEVEYLLAMLLVEEAFGYDDEAEDFDQAFFAESVEGLVPLAALSAERVDQLQSTYAESCPEATREHDAHAAATLLRWAWEEGPEPINPEHVREAASELSAEEDASEAGVTASLARFLAFLEQQRLLGPLRRTRLARVLGADEPAPTVH